MGEYKIYIVEDDETIAGSVEKHLVKWDYCVKVAEDFKNLTAEISQFKPDLILLDVLLPFHNGFYWCSEIRKFSKVPIIFVSSLDDNMNIVMAMDMGGDDYITKPFDLSVLTAKINAAIRRAYSFQGKVNFIEHNGVVLNLSDAVASKGNKNVELTKNEFRILTILMENAGQMVSRDTIMTQLWESDEFVDDNTLTVNVARIRKKLTDIGAEDYIVTRKGIGYMVQ